MRKADFLSLAGRLISTEASFLGSNREMRTMIKLYLITALKAAACGIVFFIGTILVSALAGAVGLPAPAIPEGSDTMILMQLLLLVSLGTGAILAFLSTRIHGSFLLRWLLLAAFGWVIYSATTYIEAIIYTTFESASLYKVVMDLVGFVLAAALAAAFFRPPVTTENRPLPLTSSSWAWRIAAAWIAFPVIYLSFGKLVEPFVIDVYRQGLLEMRAPGWGQIIPTQLLRSLMLLAVCLPLVRRWIGSRTTLWASLTAALFLLTGGFYMIQAYWFPVGFRLIHSLEILADSAVYIAVLTVLFLPSWSKNGQTAQLPVKSTSAAKQSPQN
jgi:hypothetical protein